MNNSSNPNHVEDKRIRPRNRKSLRLHAARGPNLAVPVSDAQIARVNDSSVTASIRIANQAATSRPLRRSAGKMGIKARHRQAKRKAP